jgi:DNA-binding NtrC family response regulator
MNVMEPEKCADEEPKVLRVLVVDDEPGFRNLLQWELSRHGMQVETACDGAEGVHLAGKKEFDVIITDITMPVMNGLSLLEEIKRTAPQTRVIIATGFGAVETAVYAMQNGAFDFVLKPYDLEQLLHCVHKATDRRSHCRQCGKKNHE